MQIELVSTNTKQANKGCWGLGPTLILSHSHSEAQAVLVLVQIPVCTHVYSIRSMSLCTVTRCDSCCDVGHHTCNITLHFSPNFFYSV